jgi:hypothetical protein
MRTRFVLLGFFLLSASVVMAQSDWVDRMIAASPAVTLSGQAGPDWADRMIAAGSASGMPQPEDWVERLVADRGTDFAPQSLLQIEKVKTALLEAERGQDLQRALSLFAGDAVINASGRTYSGTSEIRVFWESTPPFRAANDGASYSPAARVRIETSADRAMLQIDTVWIDAGTGRVRARTYSSDILVRDGDRWLIKEMSSRAVQV